MQVEVPLSDDIQKHAVNKKNINFSIPKIQIKWARGAVVARALCSKLFFLKRKKTLRKRKNFPKKCEVAGSKAILFLFTKKKKSGVSKRKIKIFLISLKGMAR